MSLVVGQLGLEVLLFGSDFDRFGGELRHDLDEAHEDALAGETGDDVFLFSVNFGTVAFVERTQVLDALVAAQDGFHAREVSELGDGVVAGTQVVNAFLADEDPEALAVWDVQGTIFIGVALEEFGVLLLLIELGVEEETVSGTDVAAGVHGEEGSPGLEKDFIIIFFIYCSAFQKAHLTKIVGWRLTYFVF